METIIAKLRDAAIPYRLTASGSVRILGDQKAQIRHVRGLYLLSIDGPSFRIASWFDTAEAALRAALGQPIGERMIGRIELLPVARKVS